MIRNWIHSLYKAFQKESYKVEEIEEIMVVSEEWVKLAGFANGVVEHVIAQRLVDEEKQEMLKRIAIETGKQID
jgi:hypothetical protein